MIQLFGHEAAVNTITFSSDGRFLASGGGDGRVLLWEPGISTESRELPLPSDAGPKRPITTLAFAPVGRQLVMGRSAIQHHNRHHPAVLGSWKILTDEVFRRAVDGAGSWPKVAFNPLDGTLVAAGQVDHIRLQVYDMPHVTFRGGIRHCPTCSNSPILLAVAPECVIVGQIGAPLVNLYHVSGMTRTLWCDRPYGAARGFALHPDGRLILATPGALLVWPTDDVRAEATPVPVDPTPLITSVAISPDGMTLALGREGGQVQQLDTITWKVRDTFAWAVGDVLDLTFAPDGFRIAAAGDTGEIIIWDVE